MSQDHVTSNERLARLRELSCEIGIGADLTWLLDERDRLRAALERFMTHPNVPLCECGQLGCATRQAREALSGEPGDLPQPPYTVTKTDDGLFLERGSDETPLPPASNPSLYDVLVEAGSYFRQQQEVHAGYRDGPYWGGLAVAAAREAAKALESPVETAGDWLTNEQCDDVIAFLEDYEWTGLTRENVRTWCTAIAEARSSVKASADTDRCPACGGVPHTCPVCSGENG